jgi:hypothetical protein
MDIIVFEEATYWKMQRELMSLFTEALKQAKVEAAKDDEWLTFDQAKAILGYTSKRQWQKLRDQGKVKYSKYGRKIRYSRKSLYEFMEKHLE